MRKLIICHNSTWFGPKYIIYFGQIWDRTWDSLKAWTFLEQTIIFKDKYLKFRQNHKVLMVVTVLMVLIGLIGIESLNLVELRRQGFNTTNTKGWTDSTLSLNLGRTRTFRRFLLRPSTKTMYSFCWRSLWIHHIWGYSKIAKKIFVNHSLYFDQHDGEPW